ncbi:putative intracellular protein transport protein [Botrytis fragariae]|uniref:Putative intracellular protein transport protein n=1 Tax=Botrytis fragariae TaxID=1964551 RepID=A0A8H6AN19_9HELO|nr:putative intracellular protein transport protein [Botrytis fragariae]KAF5870366.1 putative intracellular protein transport protein [Botrytis fragariae]
MSKVGETISVYASRLTSSTLLEDRRAACLGLRSFAKDYPASVASEALRGLITSLRKDGEDVDSIKVVLETLLFLFNPNQNSAEASEELAYFIADEFTTRQDNITLLLDFLDTNDFYSRLYSLQLLSLILSSRAERTEECIFTAPLGISRLVAVLDDRREAIRNEGLSLLTYLTPSSSELQKLVAFENAFDRIFNIIKLEGSLQDGDRIVEDCLILLANLLRLNVSNQSFFRETGCVTKLSKLLNDALGADNEAEEVAEWAKVQRNRNIYALLAVLRLFLITGGVGTQANQVSFAQHGILNQVLQLAFSRSTEVQIKAEALSTCADMIRGNATLQENFAQQQVTSVLDEPLADSNGQTQHNVIPKVYVIDGLLDLTLSVPTLSAFDSRAAACECIKAYFYNHPAIRKHFLRRAIDGHVSGADETANVLTTLLQPLDSHISSDPYRYWFASVLLFHLIFEDAGAKSMAMGVAEGDAENGEEVITCIQSITANLILGVHKAVDERVLVAYLMLLCGWLFEDPDAVNDFLGEGSNIQSLIQAAQHTGGDGVMVQGLCAVLLGIVYEFSTKDSPVPRATIHPILGSKLGRDQYIDRLTKLRAHPLLRDFEVLPQKLSSAAPGSLPDVFFDKSFVDFIKDNFSRLLRAIDRDPGFEIAVIANGVQKGISREMVDTLRSELDEKTKALLEAEEELVTLGGQLGQEQADHRRTKETALVEHSRIKNVNEALQRHHEEDIKRKLRVEHDRTNQDYQRQLNEVKEAAEADIARIQAESDRIKQDHQKQLEEAQKGAEANADSVRAEHERVVQDYQRQLEHVQKTAEANSERVRRRADAEIADLQSKIERLDSDLTKSNNNHVQDLQIAHDKYAANKVEQDKLLQRAEEKIKEMEEQASTAQEEATKAKEKMKGMEEQASTVQTKLAKAEEKIKELEEQTSTAQTKLAKAEADLQDKETARQAVQNKVAKVEADLQDKETARQAAQSELDDLLMVFGDMEEKVTKYKERLKALGENVSDDEDDDDDDDDEGEEEESGVD